MTHLLLLTHAGTTLFLTGLIWLIQVVHYPMFALVGREAFHDYHLAHVKLITPVVGPPMLIELFCAVALLVMRPAEIPSWAPSIGLALLAVVWISTALLQVPAHNALGAGLDLDIATRLSHSNWLRTAAWTARSGIALYMVWLVMSARQPLLQ